MAAAFESLSRRQPWPSSPPSSLPHSTPAQENRPRQTSSSSVLSLVSSPTSSILSSNPLKIAPSGLPPVSTSRTLSSRDGKMYVLAGYLLILRVLMDRRVFVQDEPPVPEADRAALREALVPAMISLSNPSDKAVRAQVAESISLVAKSDFPERWPDLVNVSVYLLSSSRDPDIETILIYRIRVRNSSRPCPILITRSTLVFLKLPTLSSVLGAQKLVPTPCSPSSTMCCQISPAPSSNSSYIPHPCSLLLHPLRICPRSLKRWFSLWKSIMTSYAKIFLQISRTRFRNSSVLRMDSS